MTTIPLKLSTPTRDRSAMAPLLIQVPALLSRGDRVRRLPLLDRRRGTKARRRLRRELRIAATLLLCLMPVAGLVSSSWGLASRGASASESVSEPPAPRRGELLALDSRQGPAIDDYPEPARPTLSIAPVPTDRAIRTPIVRPAGYLLPDDGIGLQESGHAGS